VLGTEPKQRGCKPIVVAGSAVWTKKIKRAEVRRCNTQCSNGAEKSCNLGRVARRQKWLQDAGIVKAKEPDFASWSSRAQKLAKVSPERIQIGLGGREHTPWLLNEITCQPVKHLAIGLQQVGRHLPVLLFGVTAIERNSVGAKFADFSRN
jgi:hypothetical protein